MSSLQTERTPEAPEREIWIWKAFARSVRNNILGEIGVQIVRIAGMVILARALAPADFGLFRILITITTIVMIINELGVPDTLVQRRDLRVEHESTAAWANLIVSISTASLLFVGAPLIARAMAMPALPPALRLLCIPLAFEGLASISAARLIRRLEFGRLAMAEVAAELAFVIVAIALLLLKMPRWCLAGGLASRLCGHALTLYSAEPYVPRGRPTRRALLEMRGFAGGVLTGRILCSLSNNADYLMVGRLLGPAALGFYGMAWDLLRFVPDRLYKVAGRVTTPAFCRLQDRPAAMRRAFLDFLGYVSRVVLPILVCVAIAAPELLRDIYGAKWIPAAMPMRILSVGLISVGMRAGMGAVYYAKGRPSLDVYLHSLRLAFIVVAIAATAHLGLVAVSVAMSVVELSISGLGQVFACKLVDASLSSVFASVSASFKTAAMCAAGVIVGKAVAGGLELRGVLALAVMALPAVFLFLWFEAGTARELVASAFNSARGVTSASAQGEIV